MVKITRIERKDEYIKVYTDLGDNYAWTFNLIMFSRIVLKVSLPLPFIVSRSMVVISSAMNPFPTVQVAFALIAEFSSG
ncbi:unnamed protein product, partial [marine sediment metagenome]